MPKECCQNCHFLAKQINIGGAIGPRLSWDNEDRSNLQIKRDYAAQCEQGIWDTDIDPNLNLRLPEILQKQRRDTCFFIEAQAGMSFGAARALHKIRYETRNLKRTLLITQIGLWVSALGVIANLGYSIFRDFGITP